MPRDSWKMGRRFINEMQRGVDNDDDPLISQGKPFIKKEE